MSAALRITTGSPCPCLQAMKDFEELPAQAADALRASLLELLLAFGQGAASVKIQLCLALAAVAVHMPAAQWEGGGPVQWLVHKLQRAPQPLALPCMLGVLEVLPEVLPWKDTRPLLAVCM